MGLFSMKLFHKSGSKADKSAESVLENYNVIAEQLGLTAECREIIADPRAYYNAHQDSYDERGIGSGSNIGTVIWIGIVNEMLLSHKACEFDYKEELDDFAAAMEDIMPSSLSTPLETLDEDDDITAWAEQLTDAWSDRGYALAAFDIYSDSYVIFVCRREILPTLSAAADKTGHRIALAQDM